VGRRLGLTTKISIVEPLAITFNKRYTTGAQISVCKASFYRPRSALDRYGNGSEETILLSWEGETTNQIAGLCGRPSGGH